MNRRQINARIRDFRKWFGADPFEVPAKGPIPDEIIDWCLASGASIDWIVNGDAMPMVAVARREYLAA